MKVAILGFGLQGRSAYNYYHRAGHQLTICDQNEDLKVPPDANRQLGDGYLNNLSRFDLLVRTSSLPPEKIAAANSDEILVKTTTTTNEFLEQTATPTIAITGTKGKGTTSLLAAGLLEAAGLRVYLAGNIGVDVLDQIDQAAQADVAVLELASYQTIDLRASPQVGVILRIDLDHLSWHGGFDNYLRAKAQLLANQTSDDKVVYFVGEPNSTRAAASTPAVRAGYAVDDRPEARVKVKDGQIWLGPEPLLGVDRLGLAGRHNWENICAAIAACEDFLPEAGRNQTITDVLEQFSTSPNRLELAGQIDGVRYVNDSAATNPLAARAALEATEGPKVLIVGGADKGIPADDLIAAILEADIRHLIAVGPQGPEIAKALRTKSPGFSIDECRTMAEIVQAAAARAKPGDTVLLSPGYAATHQPFGNATGRAEQFKAEVAKLDRAEPKSNRTI